MLGFVGLGFAALVIMAANKLQEDGQDGAAFAVLLVALIGMGAVAALLF